MSQSASFYSIAPTDFDVIKKSDDKAFDIAPFVKNYCTIDEAYMALEFTLVNNQDEEAVTTIEEIFNPSSSFGGGDFNDIDIDTIDPEALEALLMNDASVYYLPPATIGRVVDVLNSIGPSDILSNYDAAALNDNDIFPGKWHQDNEPSLKYNAAHIQQNFLELKSFFVKAATNNEYVLTYLQG